MRALFWLLNDVKRLRRLGALSDCKSCTVKSPSQDGFLAAPSHSFDVGAQLTTTVRHSSSNCYKLLLVSQQRIVVMITRSESFSKSKNMASTWSVLVLLAILHAGQAYRVEPSPETNSIFPAPLPSSHLSSTKQHGVKDIKIFYQSGVSWTFLHYALTLLVIKCALLDFWQTSFFAVSKLFVNILGLKLGCRKSVFRQKVSCFAMVFSLVQVCYFSWIILRKPQDL